MNRIFALMVAVIICVTAWGAQPLKVLAIGNSFSEDAVEQELHNVAAGAGDSILIGNLFIGGCSVDRHYDNITNNRPDYSYRKIHFDGTADTIPGCTLLRALTDEEWDVITFQQVSQDAGMEGSFTNLPALISAVREMAGDGPVFLWHMTWAYSTDSQHSGFRNYNRDQLAMYQAIVTTTQTILAENTTLSGIIPSGTAIQDARATRLQQFGHDLTRDGYHLDKNIARYIAACTWYGTLFHRPGITTTYHPAGITPEDAEIARHCATLAIIYPFAITIP